MTDSACKTVSRLQGQLRGHPKTKGLISTHLHEGSNLQPQLTIGLIIDQYPIACFHEGSNLPAPLTTILILIFPSARLQKGSSPPTLLTNVYRSVSYLQLVCIRIKPANPSDQHTDWDLSLVFIMGSNPPPPLTTTCDGTVQPPHLQ